MECPRRRIILRYTKEELDILEQFAHDTEGTNFNSLMFRRMIRLGKMASGDMIGDPPRKATLDLYIPEGTSCKIEELSRRFNVTPTTLIGRYAVAPILARYYENSLLDFIVR